MKQMKYLIETHFHTAETSQCANVTAADGIALYRRLGYAAVVVTDHYTGYNFQRFSGNWENKVDRFLNGYLAAKRAGDREGVRVILGIELCFERCPDDYLVYGVDRKFLIDHPRLYRMNIRDFFDLADRHGLIVVQAHPFRSYIHEQTPQMVHGFEVHNGHPTWMANNHLALDMAEEYGLLQSSGSDFHNIGGAGRGGIITDTLPETSEELARLMKSGAYELFIPR